MRADMGVLVPFIDQNLGKHEGLISLVTMLRRMSLTQLGKRALGN